MTKTPILSAIERFTAKYKVNNQGCWIWQAYRNPMGYGQIRVKQKTYYAHRWSYSYFRGRIPENHDLDHLCRTPSCVNPYHLEAVLHRENMYRSSAPSWLANRTGMCRARLHKMTDDNVIVRRGWKTCRECTNAAQRRNHARRKSATQ